MNGPCCPVSELTALNSILKDNAPYLLSFAGKEYHSTRVRNLTSSSRAAHGETPCTFTGPPESPDT